MSTPIAWTGRGNALFVGLQNHWEMSESSGTRADSVGSLDLTDNNTVGTSEGGAYFISTNSEYLSRSDTADLRLGAQSTSFGLWVKPTSGVVEGTIFSKWNVTAGTREYILYWSEWASAFRWIVSADGTRHNATELLIYNDWPVSADAWHYIVVGYDADRNTLYGNLDGQGDREKDFGFASPSSLTSQFCFGRYVTGQYFDGIMLSASLWRRRLHSSESNILYYYGLT